MEFLGRIVRVLPTRSGTSERTGNEWKALPFVFEYYEGQWQRFPDRVLLETFDTTIMRQIGTYMAKDGEGKAIEENGSLKMMGEIPARCGFGINIREYNGRTYNEVKMYSMVILSEKLTDGNVLPPLAQPTEEVFETQATVTAPFGASEQAEDDDLPF